MEYNLPADLLNKFSQLTPWVQLGLAVTVAGTICGLALLAKEAVAAPFRSFPRRRERSDAVHTPMLMGGRTGSPRRFAPREDGE